MAFRFKRRAITHSNSTIATLQMAGSTGLSDGTVGSSYIVALTATGGVLPYAFSAINAVPPGLSVNSTGSVLGTPSTTVISTFSVQVQDAQGSTARQAYRLEVISSGATGPLQLSIQNSTGAPQGVVGSSYALTINSTGGVAPYPTFTLASGTLPAGITLASTGSLNGIPSTTGTSTFTLQVTDSVGSTASQSFRLNVISSGADVGPHAYYNALVARPDVYRSWSLRSQSTVDTVNPVSSVWSYIWPADGYQDAQDAMKFMSAPRSSAAEQDSIPSSAQIKFPLAISTGSVFITWDFYYGIEFKQHYGGVATHKAYQVGDGDSTGAYSIYCELRNGYKDAEASTAVAVYDNRCYQMKTESTHAWFVPGLSTQPAYKPTGQGALDSQTFGIKANVWTRYFMELHTQKTGDQFTEWNATSTGTLPSTTTYRMFSIWLADEATDPTRVLYRVPWRLRKTFLTKFVFEFNTSSPPSSNGNPVGMTGTQIGYARNVVMLRDPVVSEADSTLFARPER